LFGANQVSGCRDADRPVAGDRELGGKTNPELAWRQQFISGVAPENPPLISPNPMMFNGLPSTG